MTVVETNPTLNDLINLLISNKIDGNAFRTYLLAELHGVIGEDIEIEAKYEGAEIQEDGTIMGPVTIEHGAHPNVVGEQITHLLRFADDMARNNEHAEQRERLEEFVGDGFVIYD